MNPSKAKYTIAVLTALLHIPAIALSEIIFQDDFNNFTSGWLPSDPSPGHHVTGGTTGNPGRGEPEGWTGWINHDRDNFIAIVPNEGVNGTPCLKIGAAPGHSPFEQVGLVKYLGPDGYNELFIRYKVKYDDNWRWGNGTNGSLHYHKWLRIWQNVQEDEVLGNSGNLSDEHNRGFLLITTTDDAYGSFDPYFMGTFSQDPTKNSVELPYTTMWSYRWVDSKTGGFIENHFGQIDNDGYWTTNQQWHTIEIHLKLATSPAHDDGIFELRIDGILQDPPEMVDHHDGRAITHNKLPTPQYGTGMNYIGLHDNGSGNQYWQSHRYVWIDDFSVSTSSMDIPSPAINSITLDQ